jgi:hypothetical protein
MSRSGARSRVLDALDPDDFIELEDRQAKPDGSAIYVPWPQPHARKAGVDGATGVRPYVHPSGALLYLPPGVTLGEALQADV